MVRLIKAAFGVITVGLLAYVLFEQRRLFVTALAMPWRDFVLISVFTLVNWLISSFMYVRMLRPLHVRFPFWQMVGVHIVAGLLNYLPFRVGTLYRARLFKTLANFRYSYFASLFALNFLMMAASAGLVGLTNVAFNGLAEESGEIVLLTVFAAMVLVSAIMILVPLAEIRSHSRIAKIWNDLSHARGRIIEQRRLCLLLFCCYVLVFGCAAFRFVGGYDAAGTTVTFDGALILGSINVVSMIVSFSPGGLGIQEFVAGLAGSAIGISIGTTVVVAAIIRAIMILWYLVLGVPAFFWLRKLESNARARKQPDGNSCTIPESFD